MFKPESIQPTDGYLLVFKSKPSEKTTSGIFVSESLQKKEQEFPVFEVFSCGKNSFTYSAGDVIILSPIVNQMTVFGYDYEDEIFYIIQEELVIGKVNTL